MIKVLNPGSIPAPSGSYVHGLEVPANARLLFIAAMALGAAIHRFALTPRRSA